MPNRRSDAFALPERTAVGGICREMVSRAIGYMVREWRAEAIRISAQSYLIPFYESFGFEVVSDEYLEAGIPHKKMLIRLDREHGREA